MDIENCMLVKDYTNFMYTIPVISRYWIFQASRLAVPQ